MDVDVNGRFLLTANACVLASVLLTGDGPIEVLDYGLLGAAFVLLVLSVEGSGTANGS